MNKTEKNASPRKVLKPLPVFETDSEEREFWATADSSEYVDGTNAKRTGSGDIKTLERRGRERGSRPTR